MIDLGKLPLEKGVHLFAKVLPGFTLFLFYDCLHHGTIAKLLSIPYLGYGSRVTLFVIVCFLCGYTLAALLSGLLTPLAGALGGVWGSFRGARHPYEDEVAPWRNEKWRLAYQRRYETSAPKSLNLVSKPIVDQLFKDARSIEPHPVDPAHAAVFAQEIYQQLNAAVEAIANDKEWRMLYDHLHSELILEKRMEAIEEIMTGLDSDLAMSAAVLLLGAIFCVQFRNWWLLIPALGLLVVSILRMSAKIYQLARPWSTLNQQIEFLNSIDHQGPIS